MTRNWARRNSKEPEQSSANYEDSHTLFDKIPFSTFGSMQKLQVRLSWKVFDKYVPFESCIRFSNRSHPEFLDELTVLGNAEIMNTSGNHKLWLPNKKFSPTAVLTAGYII